MAVKTFYLRTNSAGSQPSGGKTWTLEESSGSGNNSSTVVSIGKTAATNKFLFQPGNDNNTSLGTSYPSAIQKYGWVTTGTYNGTFPSGNWTFYNRIGSNQASTAKGKIAVRVYRVTAQNLGGTNTLISPTGAGNGWNESSEQTLSAVQTYDVTWAASFDQTELSNEYIYAEYIWNITYVSGKTAQDVVLYAESAYSERIVTTEMTEKNLTKTYTLDSRFKKLGFSKTYTLDTTFGNPVGPAGLTHATDAWHQRKIFYSAGRYWVFWYASNGDVRFSSSTNAITWDSYTVVRTGGTGDYGAGFALYFDGTFIHYAYSDYDDPAPPEGNAIFYRRGTPNTDGTISWNAPEQTARAAEADYSCLELSIAVDTSGHAYIAYEHYSSSSATDIYPFIIRNANTDGTWSTDSGYPVQLSSTNGYWYTCVLPLTSNKMYCLYNDTKTAPYTIYGKLYDGSWGNAETVATDSNLGSTSVLSSAVTPSTDDIHVLYWTSTSGTISYKIRNSSGWQSREDVDTGITTNKNISLTAQTGGTVYASFVSGNVIYYKRRISGTWDSSRTTVYATTMDDGSLTSFFKV